VSFLYDHGINVRSCIPWSLPFVYRGHETIESTDPLWVPVDVRMADESLIVTMDRGGAVVSTERNGSP